MASESVYRQRKLFRDAVKEYGGPALPDHSWIFGSLITVGKTAAKRPSMAAGQFVFHWLALDYPDIQKAGVVYVDLWPISSPTIASFDPDLTAQFALGSRPKHSVIKWEFASFSGNKDLVSSEGPVWKKWRSMYNPGFSSQSVFARVPDFVEEAMVWKEYLLSVADTGETIRFETSTMKATCDVIARSVFGARTHIQTTDSRLWWALKKSISYLYADWSPQSWHKILNPARPLVVWYCNRVMRQEIKPYVEAQLQTDQDSAGSSKTIVSLALRAYHKDNNRVSSSGKHRIDKDFLDATIEQIKIFLFAGHDTTSSTLCFALDQLHRHPEAMAKVQQEHKTIFGPDASAAGQQLIENPILLNKLPYTTAVLKETLRMFPPIGSVLAGSSTFFLTHPRMHACRLPTDGFMIHDCQMGLHRNPDVWTAPDDFVPERWLTGEMQKNTWRPFGMGPRNCIGQELAMTELKMLLALTVRELDIVPSYDEADPWFLGTQAFQAALPGEFVAHPNKGFPVKIRTMRQKA
ncbi:cytochrome p450 domain-containing protein [Sarocladium implicatum]|nr:cytochrome p450 domain-containing protein [Sarocladium implicatum]